MQRKKADLVSYHFFRSCLCREKNKFACEIPPRTITLAFLSQVGVAIFACHLILIAPRRDSTFVGSFNKRFANARCHLKRLFAAYTCTHICTCIHTPGCIGHLPVSLRLHTLTFSYSAVPVVKAQNIQVIYGVNICQMYVSFTWRSQLA